MRVDKRGVELAEAVGEEGDLRFELNDPVQEFTVNDIDVGGTRRMPSDDDGEEEVEAPRSKSAKRSKKEVSTDEEIARKLDQELNSRQRSSRSGAKPKKTPGKRSKKVKSAETI